MRQEYYCNVCKETRTGDKVCEFCYARLMKSHQILLELNQAFERELKDYAATVERLRKENSDLRADCKTFIRSMTPAQVIERSMWDDLDNRR